MISRTRTHESSRSHDELNRLNQVLIMAPKQELVNSIALPRPTVSLEPPLTTRHQFEGYNTVPSIVQRMAHLRLHIMRLHVTIRITLLILSL